CYLRPVTLVAHDRVSSGQEGAHVIDAALAQAVRQMQEEVVRAGSPGAKASVTGYRRAGKTGTAGELAAGWYSRDKFLSIFAGLGPARGPKLAAVVIVDEPHGDLYYGSDAAAPVFADVKSEALRLLAVPPDALPARDPGSVMQAMSKSAAKSAVSTSN